MSGMEKVGLDNYAHLGPKPIGPEEFENVLANPPKVISVDTETINLDDRSLTGIGFATDRNNSFWIPMRPTISPYIPKVLSMLARPDITKVYHNLLFDLDTLRPYGMDESNIIDSMVIAHMNGLPLKLADICDQHGWEIGSFPKGMKSTLNLPAETLAKKNLLDTSATYKLWEEYNPKTDQRILSEEMDLIPILLDMSERGIKVDQALAQKYEGELDWKVRGLKMICEDEHGFNPASPKQVGEKLISRGNYIPLHRTEKGDWAPTTDEDTLSKLSDPLASMILLYRKWAKLKSTYVTPLVGKNRVNTQFTLVPATGRLSSREPNMQNYPSKGEWKKLRDCFIPDDIYWTLADFSQQELRLLQFVSGDKAMAYIYTHAKCTECGYEQSVDRVSCVRCGATGIAGDGKPRVRPLDLHTETAKFLDIERKIAKNCNFALVYGATAATISETAEINNVKKAEQIIRDWGRKFPEAFAWMEGAKQFALEHHYALTIGGRKLWIRETNFHEIEKRGVNYVIQGSGAEICKTALRRMRHTDLRLQVHDEVLANGDWVEQVNALGLSDIVPGLHIPFEPVLVKRWTEKE